MRRVLRVVRNIVIFLATLPTLLLIGFIVEFVYRTNSCALGDHVIQSEADAIEVAKKKIVKDSYFSSAEFGSAPDFVDSLSKSENCCTAVRSRTPFLVVVWDVSLSETPTTKSTRFVKVFLSNCGTIFIDESYKDRGEGK
jgi:hypothetical protein